MTSKYLDLMIAESSDLADLLATLTPGQWDGPTLCNGWRVRDVVSHMVVGHTMPVLAFSAALARHGFRVAPTSYALARAYADKHPADHILSAFRAATHGAPRAAAKFVPVPELFTDHLVHQQDIRRPLQRPREIPQERLVAALDTLPQLSSRVGSAQRMSGLRLIATDVDHTVGEGPANVTGTAEALVIALTGRRAALSELDGPGLAALTDRLAPAARRRTRSPVRH